MKIMYIRTSTLNQNSDRQRINEKDFNLVIEDTCSGSIAFADREGGRRVIKLLKSGEITSLSVISIDRLGRNLKDLLTTIEMFTEKRVPIIFLNQGLRTLDEDGKENSIATLTISILGIVAQMERVQLLERQKEGIDVAKAQGKYTGRKSNTKEDTLQFLSKPKNRKALEYLKMGNLRSIEISKLAGVHINTITKIKKLGLSKI